MLKIYGTMLCKDCVSCLAALDRAKVAYEFLDISGDLSALKAFLAIRDSSRLFDEVRTAGKIGIPCLVDGRGNVSLSWERYVRSGRA